MKQISQALEAEEDAIKRVTAEVEQLRVRKNAETTAIRSWRFKYRAWKTRVELVKSNELMSEDKVKLLQSQINTYNVALRNANADYDLSEPRERGRYTSAIRRVERHVNFLSNSDIRVIADAVQATTADVESAKSAMKREREQAERQNAVVENNRDIRRHNQALADAYEDELTQAKAEYNRKLAQYEDELKAYNDANTEEFTASEYVDDINGWCDGVKVAKVTGQGLVAVDDGAINDLAQEYVNQYQRMSGNISLEDMLSRKLYLRPSRVYVNWDGLQEMYADDDYNGIQSELASALYKAIHQDVNVVNKELTQSISKSDDKPQKPIMAEIERPKYLEEEELPQEQPIELPKFTHFINYAPVFHENAVDESLIAEMDSYASGPYKRSEEHTEEINALADRIGHDCPKKIEVDKAYDNNDLVSALDELESTWQDFGSQRNSVHGASIVDKFKDATKQLRDAHNFDELDSGARKFSTASTSLMIWLQSNWWQKGGTPTGNAHPWKGMHGLKLGQNNLGLK